MILSSVTPTGTSAFFFFFFKKGDLLLLSVGLPGICLCLQEHRAESLAGYKLHLTILYNPKIDTKRVSVVPSQSDSGANRGRGDCWIREQPPESPAFQPQLRNFPAGAQSKPR